MQDFLLNHLQHYTHTLNIIPLKLHYLKYCLKMSDAKRFKREVSAQKSEQILIEVNKFKNELNEFDEIYEKLELGYNRPKEYIYEECANLRRRIQLDTEETIADIKMKNNLDFKSDESELNASLLLIVNGLNKQNDSMIAAVDKYEKEVLVLFDYKKEQNKIHLAKEIKKSIVEYEHEL